MEQKRMYSTSETAKRIGVKPHQLNYAITNGEVKDASEKFLGKRIFSENDIERLKQYFQHKKGKQR